VLTYEAVLALPASPADLRLAYGPETLQSGELRLPAGEGPHPVVVVLHGGCWRAENDARHIAPLSSALTALGYATWTPEYRRVGDGGGGWPGTFLDVARSLDFLRTLAEPHSLDLSKIVLLGHSAGGHLALWAAARHQLPASSELFTPEPLPVRGVVSLAGISDLRTYSAGTGTCNQSALALMGGTPEDHPDRYDAASPLELLPSGVHQRILHGSLDAIVPVSQSRLHATKARNAGDDAQLWLIPTAGHFELIVPEPPAWDRVVEAVHSVLGN